MTAARSDAPKVSLYAARARSVHTAAVNSAHDSPAAVTSTAPSGTATSTAKYNRVNPRLSRNPGSTRRLVALMRNCCATSGGQRQVG